MSDDMPDWLAGLVSAPEDEDDDQLLAATVQPQASAVQPQVAAPQPQTAVPQPQIVFEDGDLMADLRSQVAVEEEPALAPPARQTRSRYVFGLLPWQIFFLAVLMFLDVAVIGLLFLVMLGRVVLPF